MDEAQERLFQTGRAAYLRNDLDEAIRALRASFQLGPDNQQVAFALGTALAKAGKLFEGYPLLNRWRFKEPDRAAPALPIPRWVGQPLAGKRVLIWSEDGAADQIMFARYARQMVAAGGEVAWLCPPELARLIASLGVQALPNDEAVTISGFDYYCPSSALLSAFTYAISGEPYLSASPRTWGGVGVMTSAGADADRTLPPTARARLLALPGAVDLDPQATGAGDFMDTAAIIAGLHLVVTVDTAVAHLAGALGAPVRILLPYLADWRWQVGRSDSPWYASARLFRQPSPGAWEPAVEAALTDLTAAVSR